MLFYKAWRESRIRFLAAVIALTLWCAIVFPDMAGSTDRLVRMLRGQTFSQYIDFWVFNSLGHGLFLLLVMFLGVGGLLRERAHRTAIFTLALPVARAQLAGAQIAVGLGELAVLSFLPAPILQLLSWTVHQSYVVGDAMRFGLLRLICGAVVLSVTYLFSVILKGEYTAIVGCWIVLMLDGRLSSISGHDSANLLRIIQARWESSKPGLTGPLPWTLLSILMLISLALFAAATRITERQDI